MKIKQYSPNKSWVKAGNDWVDMDSVEIVNIEESLYGYDKVRFIYNDFEYESYVLMSKIRPICANK